MGGVSVITNCCGPVEAIKGKLQQKREKDKLEPLSAAFLNKYLAPV